MRDSGGDPYDGVHLRYVHPVHGGSTLPTFSCEVQLLNHDQKTKTHRHNSNVIYQVFRGSGATVVDNQTLHWNQGDIFVVPAWHWHSHESHAEGDSILFSMTDAPAFMALGLYREERASE